jgi:hyperosmotically inducible periplasmic protein
MRRFISALVVLTLIGTSALAAHAAGRTTSEKVDDATITTKVKAKLATERVKNLVSVNVDTQDGVVHLQGTVPTAADKAEAERLARATNGVRSVTNDLKISSAETGSSPAASPGTPPRSKY